MTTPNLEAAECKPGDAFRSLQRFGRDYWEEGSAVDIRHLFAYIDKTSPLVCNGQAFFESCAYTDTGSAKHGHRVAKSQILGEMATTPKRILLATIGSLGDLHPCLALALGLRDRGHQPIIASTELYRAKVEGLGLEFHAIRPNVAAHDPKLMGDLMDMKRGPDVLLRQLILPALPDTYEDLLKVATGADLLIAGEIVFAAPLVAEKLRLPWVSALLSPFSFYSVYDPPVSPYAPSLAFLSRLGWRFNKIFIALGRLAFRQWWEPVHRLRRELGLRPGGDPLFQVKFSSSLTLALFSREIARPQPDWPANAVQPGYVFYDQDEARSGLPAGARGISCRLAKPRSSSPWAQAPFTTRAVFSTRVLRRRGC